MQPQNYTILLVRSSPRHFAGLTAGVSPLDCCVVEPRASLGEVLHAWKLQNREGYCLPLTVFHNLNVAAQCTRCEVFQGCRCTLHGHQVQADRSDDRPAGVVESPNHEDHFGGQGALPELRFVELASTVTCASRAPAAAWKTSGHRLLRSRLWCPPVV